MRSIVLLSGGLDSAVSLAMAVSKSQVIALSIDYGQSNSLELDCAGRLATTYFASHITVNAKLGFLDSLLTRSYPLKQRGIEEIESDARSPMIVPARNQFLLSIALCLAEQTKSTEIIISANKDDAAFPDCQRHFFSEFTAMAATCTETRPLVSAPLLEMSKAQVAEMAVELGVPIAETCSCYRPLKQLPDGKILHCGKCDACVIRREAFIKAKLDDPTEYA